MRFSELLSYGSSRLEAAGVDEFDLDSRLLLEYCSKKSRTELLLESRQEVDPQIKKHFLTLLERREQREPVAYILGEWEFWSLNLYVSPAVLIPRPETEFLLESVLRIANPANFSKGNILDLCCGSGAIGLVLAKETGKKVLCSDLSTEALKVAKRNLACHELLDNVFLIQGDLLNCFLSKRQFSLIVSNPPYVSRFELQSEVQPEVGEFEPRLALDGGADGLDCIRRIAEQLPFVLSEEGELFMEIGANQGDSVKELLQSAFDKEYAKVAQIDVLKDYSSRDRVVHVRLKK